MAVYGTGNTGHSTTIEGTLGKRDDVLKKEAAGKEFLNDWTYDAGFDKTKQGKNYQQDWLRKNPEASRKDIHDQYVKEKTYGADFDALSDAEKNAQYSKYGETNPIKLKGVNWSYSDGGLQFKEGAKFTGLSGRNEKKNLKTEKDWESKAKQDWINQQLRGEGIYGRGEAKAGKYAFRGEGSSDALNYVENADYQYGEGGAIGNSDWSKQFLEKKVKEVEEEVKPVEEEVKPPGPGDPGFTPPEEEQIGVIADLPDSGIDASEILPTKPKEPATGIDTSATTELPPVETAAPVETADPVRGGWDGTCVGDVGGIPKEHGLGRGCYIGTEGGGKKPKYPITTLPVDYTGDSSTGGKKTGGKKPPVSGITTQPAVYTGDSSTDKSTPRKTPGISDYSPRTVMPTPKAEDLGVPKRTGENRESSRQRRMDMLSGRDDYSARRTTRERADRDERVARLTGAYDDWG